LGFIVGSSNNPKKCWSADNWANLCKSLVHYNRAFTFFLYGTKADASIASKIIDQLPEFIMVKNCAGETTISELAEEFRTCRAVIGCDSGGVHLANSLGVKVFVLFGPTNPKVTSPCFDSDYQIILPEGSPESGGLDINRLAPSEVFDVVTENL
jgi:ADP-heptose:LPS heptosyltransferase